MKEQNTDIIQIADYFPEQSFLEDQEATPVVDIESNLEEVFAFQERMKGYRMEELVEAKNKLLKRAGELQNELPTESIDIKDWHHEIYRLLEINSFKT